MDFANIYKKTNFKKLASIVFMIVMFLALPRLIQYFFYSIQPFDHFVNIEKQILHDIDGYKLTFLTNRRVKTDIKATAIKEVYRVDDLDTQLPSTVSSEFVFERNLNDQDFLFEIFWEYPIEDDGDYYVVDHIMLHLPMGIKKQKTITTNTITHRANENTGEFCCQVNQ